ncbi:hypothetical protein BC938DRAFT_470743 [Jimgerdemannia flammicorona]|uniref:Uncharacterized protein n=1 Tax=Jimgerdemannia flammicorona TaxID=994334 RepID=A0A433Q9L4_9FUNG|nr:hypothetical protein BC938DRAFT_470743 [Jimgerdemannia flammicorona]
MTTITNPIVLSDTEPTVASDTDEEPLTRRKRNVASASSQRTTVAAGKAALGRRPRRADQRKTPRVDDEGDTTPDTSENENESECIGSGDDDDVEMDMEEGEEEEEEGEKGESSTAVPRRNNAASLSVAKKVRKQKRRGPAKPFTEAEDKKLIKLIVKYGGKWCRVADGLAAELGTSRTGNTVKSRFLILMKYAYKGAGWGV